MDFYKIQTENRTQFKKKSIKFLAQSGKPFCIENLFYICSHLCDT